LVGPVVPAELAERAVSAVLEDLAGWAALVGPVVPVELEERVASVVSEDLAELAVQVALVVLENLAVREVLVVRAVPENPAVPVELIVPAEAVLVQDHRPARLVVALRTKSVIAARHPDQVPLLAVEEDLAAAAVETTREPAVAEAAIAWAVADTVAVEEAAAVTEPAAVVEDAGVVVTVAEDAAVAVEDDEDKTTVDEEKTNEIKNRYYDFVENFCDRLRDR
jgi:hypothetical protein